MTNQPDFKCIANLGDATPWEYGGAFVLVDQTGVYTPELRVFEEPWGKKYEEYSILLDQCTYINGVLSDNKYHPEYKAWFADSIPAIAESLDSDALQLLNKFCSDNPIERAWAYLAMFQYGGPQDDPSTYDRNTAMSRMKKWLREAAQYEAA